MATKSELINKISIMPLGVIEKLADYADRIIVPDDDMLTNVTMSQMMAEAFNLADDYFPEWTDRGKSDFGTFLLELMALFSEKDFWYINAFASQSLLRNVSVYSIAFLRAVELGYRPVVTTCAKANFEMAFGAGPATPYPKGAFKFTLLNGLTFTNRSLINVSNVSAHNMNVAFYNGDYFEDNVIFNGRSIDIRKTLVDPSTIDVTVDSIVFTRVNVFGNSSSSSNHYMVLPEEDGTLSIFFGDGVYGYKVPVGANILVSYISCKAASGNTAIQSVTVTRQLSARPLSALTMSTVSSGGLAPSTLAAIKNEALAFYNNRRSCINEYTATEWLIKQPEVSKAYIFASGPFVNVLFTNKAGVLPTTTERDDVMARITPLLDLGRVANYLATTLVAIPTIDIDLYYLVGTDTYALSTGVKQLVQDYTDPSVLAEYGGGFNLTYLANLLYSKFSGLQNVVFATPSASVNISPSAILGKVAQVDINLTLHAVS